MAAALQHRLAISQSAEFAELQRPRDLFLEPVDGAEGKSRARHARLSQTCHQHAVHDCVPFRTAFPGGERASADNAHVHA